MKLKIKNQKRDFNTTQEPKDFIETNIENFEDIYAEQIGITPQDAHNLKLDYRAELQTEVI